MQLKPIISFTEVDRKVQPGNRAMIGGFMAVGSPLKVIDALVELVTGELYQWPFLTPGIHAVPL